MTNEERQQHIGRMRYIYNHLGAGVPATEFLPCLETITAAISALEREGEMEAQSRTLRKELDTVADRLGETVQENVRLRVEIKELKAAITKAAEEDLSQ